MWTHNATLCGVEMFVMLSHDISLGQNNSTDILHVPRVIHSRHIFGEHEICFAQNLDIILICFWLVMSEALLNVLQCCGGGVMHVYVVVRQYLILMITFCIFVLKLAFSV